MIFLVSVDLLLHFSDWELAVALAAPVKEAFIADSLRPVEIDTVSGYDSAGRSFRSLHEILQ